MHTEYRFLKRSAVAAFIASLAALPARADWTLLNMPRGVSELSREIHDMHMIMLWICTVIAVVTFGAMILAMTRFRKSKGAVADQKMLHNARLEAAWTIVPVLILVGMAIPSVEKLIRIEDTSGLTTTTATSACSIARVAPFSMPAGLSQITQSNCIRNSPMTRAMPSSVNLSLSLL